PDRAGRPGDISGAGLLGRGHQHGSQVRIRRRLDATAGDRAARPCRGRHEQAMPERDRRVRVAPPAGLAVRAGFTHRGAAADGAVARPGRASGDYRRRPGHGAAGSVLVADGGRSRGRRGGPPNLLQRTEGWPAGLYIAALAIKSGTRRSEVGFTFTGDDIFMGDYLRSELLGQISGAELSFLTRTSVLDRMCGPLCDAILSDKGSGAVLEQLEARNLLVVPLDGRREWCRYHHLLRELLRAELQRREPDLVQDLHFRAAMWYEANAMPEAAIDHAQAAGDYDRVARLILELQNPVWASGRVETVRRWMEWLRDVTAAEHYGAIAAHGSLIFALLGQPGEAERWAAAAERAVPAGILPDGSTMEATLAYMRANLGRDGIGKMRRDARIAWEGLSPASPYRMAMLFTEGTSYLLEGDAARAGPILARALDLATHAGILPFVAMVLAQQCDVAAERHEWSQVTTLAQRAATIVDDGRLGDYWTSALVYAWASRAALHQGNISQGHSYL